MDPLAHLKSGLSEVELIKEQFNKEQRLLLIGGRESSWADFDDDQSDGINIVMTKRKSQFPQFDIGGKKKRGGASAGTFDDLLIHPNVKSLFVKMKNQYRQLEHSVLACIANEKSEQQLRELQDFLQKIVQSSWVILLHISPILNAAVISKPDVVICALAGYESRILGNTQKNLIGKEKFVPTSTVTGHLIKEDHAREILSKKGLSTAEFQQLKFFVEYATKASGKQEPGPPVQLLWVDEDPKDTTGLCGIFMARLFNITPKKRGESAAAQKQPLWVDGYQLAFFGQIHSAHKIHEEFLGLTLPFEIVSNYSRLKEQRWRDTLWRLAVCTEDKFFTTRPQQSVKMDVVDLLQEMNKWLKGFVGTDVGLNTVHMMNLRRLLSKEWDCYSGIVDYAKFDSLWPYFFKAAEFIKQNRDTLWETHLMNYCFTSAMEAEALLSQKKCYTLLIRFQLNSSPKGIPSISLIVPGDVINPSYISHIGVQSLTGKEAKVYDLPLILKYSMLYYITKTDSGDKFKFMDWFDFTHFEVYGRGKADVTQYAEEDPQAIATMMTTEKNKDPNAPLAGYAGKRKVSYTIQVVPFENEMVDYRFGQILSSPLGTVLSLNGTRENLEWLYHEIQYLDMQNVGNVPEVPNQRQIREPVCAYARVIEQEQSEQNQDQDMSMHQEESKDQFPVQPHGNLQPHAVIQPQQRPNPVAVQQQQNQQQHISSYGYTKTLSPGSAEMMQAIVNEQSTNFGPQIQQETAFGMSQQPIHQRQMQQSVQNVPGGGRMTVTNTHGYTNYVLTDQPAQAQLDTIMRQSPGMFANQQFSPNNFSNSAQSPQQMAPIGNSPLGLSNQTIGSPAMYQNYQGSPAGYQSPPQQDRVYKSPEPQYQPISHAFTQFQQAAQQQYGPQHTSHGMMQQQQYQQSVYNNQPMPGYTYNQSSMHGQQSGYGRPVSIDGMQQQFAPCSRPYDQGMHQAHAASSNQQYFINVKGFDGAPASERSSPNIQNQQPFRQVAASGAYGQMPVQFQQNPPAPAMQIPQNADMLRASMAGENVGKTERERELEEKVRILTEQLKLQSRINDSSSN